MQRYGDGGYIFLMRELVHRLVSTRVLSLKVQTFKHVIVSSLKMSFQVKIPQLEVPLSTVDLSEFNVGASVLVYITYVFSLAF